MKVLILADAGSAHIVRWVEALTKRRVDIEICSLTPDHHCLQERFGVRVRAIGNTRVRRAPSIWKPSYARLLFLVRDTIRRFKPDIIHAHFASSYGLLGALIRHHPLIVSVWGSDVLLFPRKGWIYRGIIRYVFSNADKILATSHTLAEEVSNYSAKKTSITPFGVDTVRFSPKTKAPDAIVIGIAKALEPVYRIDLLLHAFARVVESVDGPVARTLRLEIAGDGSRKAELLAICRKLGVAERVVFHGSVPHEQMQGFHQRMHIEAYTSDSESFGVSVLEAMACGCPVVVSDASGLTELVESGSTGFVVPRGDVTATAEAIRKLALDPGLRERLGRHAREEVVKRFDWEVCVDAMMNVYTTVNRKHLMSTEE